MIFDFSKRLLRGVGRAKAVAGVKVRAFQIVYDDITRGAVDPEFECLENGDAERLDWYEYWVIRRYFSSNAVDEATFYAFLSPKFGAKTGLSGFDAVSFVEENAAADVVLFSPFADNSAVFLNVFEQGGLIDVSLLNVAERFFAQHSPHINLRTMVNHSGDVVYCNFIFAKPVFWREWLAVCEKLFLASEGGVLADVLCEELSYKDIYGSRKLVQRKVFLMERVASCVIHYSDSYKVAAYPIEKVPLPDYPCGFAEKLYQMDDLKKVYAGSGDEAALRAFVGLQRNMVSKVASSNLEFIFEGLGSEMLKRK